jgi:hypothetical protein
MSSFKDLLQNASSEEFTRLVRGIWERPTPKAALDLYAAGVERCDKHSLSYEHLRVVYWELNGSQDGWFFDGAKWERASWGNPLTLRSDGTKKRLPQAPMVWLELSQDEATLAGLEDLLPLSEYQSEPSVELWREPVYHSHELRWNNLPAEPAISRRFGDLGQSQPMAEVTCQHCGSYGVAITRRSYQDVLQAIQGYRDKELQVRLFALSAEAHRRSYPTNLVNYIRACLGQPQRAQSVFSCVARPYQSIL